MTSAPPIPGRRDPVLFVILVALAFVGLFFLYPASSVTSARATGNGAAIFLTQLSRFIPGLLLLIVVAVLPIERLRSAAPYAAVGVIVLLALVFVPGFGKSVSGSGNQSFQRWIAFGPVQFQPSEFAKPAMVLYAARVLSWFDPDRGPDLGRLIAPGLLLGLMLGAILLEPQFGTTMCMALVLFALVVIGGLPWRFLSPVLFSLVPVVLLLVYAAPYRWGRLRVWLDPYRYRHEGGYQLVTSFRAFGEGGFGGEELAQGFAHRYLTYGHTDFVLALIGENFGFLGVAILIALYMALLWRGVYLLRRTEQPFALFAGAGALLMLLLQAMLNMSVVTGLLPTTGVSLPFVSFGGSSLLASFLLGGMILNASRFAIIPGRPAPVHDQSGLIEQGENGPGNAGKRR